MDICSYSQNFAKNPFRSTSFKMCQRCVASVPPPPSSSLPRSTPFLLPPCSEFSLILHYPAAAATLPSASFPEAISGRDRGEKACCKQVGEVGATIVLRAQMNLT